MLLQTRITAALVFIYTASLAQVNKHSSFYSKEGLCTSKYHLDSTGNYFTAIGCKERLTVDYGSYTLTANKVIFNSKSFNNLPPFATIKETPATNDTITKVTLLARYKKIIPDHNFAVDAIDSSGKFFKRLLLNDKGEIFINRHQYKSLRINYLNHFYTRQIYVQLMQNDVVIELSLPEEFFTPHHPQIDIRAGYTLTIKPDGLYTAAGKRVAILEN